MKSFTDIEQSKKLAEILARESADMYYPNRSDVKINCALLIELKNGNPLISQEIPAWSLSALLNVMPDRIDDSYFLTLDKEGKEYCCCYEDINGNSFRHEFGNNPIDACIEMILKLKEKNLL